MVLSCNLDEKEVKKSVFLFWFLVLGENVIFLEYEGSWLYIVGVFNVVVERLEKCIEINDVCWWLY